MNIRRTLLCGLLCAGLAGFAHAETWRHAAPGRVVAIGDVHGAFRTLVDTLQAAKLIDAEQRWQGGDAQLVSVGDLLDRGGDSRQVLDLLMRLQTEATAVGGRVHVLLGNHELMNLVGELRDVAAGEFAAFAVDETAAERDAAFASWRAVAAAAAKDASREAFDKLFPPGWFARRSALAFDGHYGAWLLERPAAIVVNDTLFVHGGTSTALAGYDLERLNREFRSQLLGYLTDLRLLERAGWIHFGVPGETRADVVRARLAAVDPTRADPAAAAATRVLAFEDAVLFGVQGPLWYRGLALCRPVLAQDVAETMVSQFGVARVAMGHSVAPTLHPTLRLRGRAVLLDTGMLRSVYRGRGNATQISTDGLVAIADDGTRAALHIDDASVQLGFPRGGEAQLEAMLRDAVVDGNSAGGVRGTLRLRISGAALDATWYPKRAGGAHELAAWRLDRALGLGLVPTTVPRTFDGVDGVLQWLPSGLVGAAAAQGGVAGGNAWCDTRAQAELLHVWDALIGNAARTEESLAWIARDWTLVASGHQQAFGASEQLPTNQRRRRLQIGPELCRRLGALDAEGVESALADAASSREQRALLRRRDRLLRDSGCAGSG